MIECRGFRLKFGFEFRLFISLKQDIRLSFVMNIYLLTTYCVPGILLGAEGTALKNFDMPMT